MAGEGGGVFLPGIGSLIGDIRRGSERKAQKRIEHQRQREDAEARSGLHPLALSAAVLRGPPQVADPSRVGHVGLPVVYSFPGSSVPPGTGSGVGAQGTFLDDPLGNTLLLATYIMRWIQERKALRQRPAAPASYSFNFGGDSLPYFSSPSYGVGGGDPFSASLGSGLAGLGAGIGSIIGALRGPATMPGGMSFLPTAGTLGSIGRVLGGLGVGAAGAGIADWLMGNNGCSSSPFTTGNTNGVRATAFMAAHPVTGKPVWFRPAGRPLLWSGDLSAARRVRRIAGRARRRLGGR